MDHQSIWLECDLVIYLLPSILPCFLFSFLSFLPLSIEKSKSLSVLFYSFSSLIHKKLDRNTNNTLNDVQYIHFAIIEADLSQNLLSTHTRGRKRILFSPLLSSLFLFSPSPLRSALFMFCSLISSPLSSCSLLSSHFLFLLSPSRPRDTL